MGFFSFILSVIGLNIQCLVINSNMSENPEFAITVLTNRFVRNGEIPLTNQNKDLRCISPSVFTLLT